MNIINVPFSQRFLARLNSGLAASLPAAPSGTGDAYWASDTSTLYLANAAGDDWEDYDLGQLGATGAGAGGTGFTTYTTGDLLVGNASNTLSKLGVAGASDDWVLTRDSSEPLGVKWAAAGAGGDTHYLQVSSGSWTSGDPGTWQNVGLPAIIDYETTGIRGTGGDSHHLIAPVNGIYQLSFHCNVSLCVTTSSTNRVDANHSVTGGYGLVIGVASQDYIAVTFERYMVANEYFYLRSEFEELFYSLTWRCVREGTLS